MTTKTVTMTVLCEECDVDDIIKQLREWYYSNNIGMEGIIFS